MDQFDLWFGTTLFPLIHLIYKNFTLQKTYSGMTRDAVCKRKMKLKKAEENLKLHLLFDRFSVELFVNDGVQVFSSTFYTPLDADDILLECEGTALVAIKKYKISLDERKGGV